MRKAPCTWAKPRGAWGGGRACTGSSTLCSLLHPPPSCSWHISCCETRAPVQIKPTTYKLFLSFSLLRSLSISPPLSTRPQSAFLPVTPVPPSHPPSFLPCSAPPQRAASHCNINLAVRGAVAMWQTCHCNGQLDKCRGVAERCGPHTIPPLCSPQCTEERRTGDARRGKGNKEWEKRKGDREEGRRGWDRESDFQRDNEPLNDGWNVAVNLPFCCWVIR